MQHVLESTQIETLPIRDTFTGVLDVDPTTTDVLFSPISIFERSDMTSVTAGKRTKTEKVYHVYMFGITANGQKICVVLKSIDVYCDVLVPQKYTADTFNDFIRTKLVDLQCNFVRTEIQYGFKLKGFQTEPSPWVRIYFHNLQDRKEVLDSLLEEKYMTANDDDARNYFSMIARKYKFNTCSWNVLPKGKYVVNGSRGTKNVSATFDIDVKDFQPLSENEITKLGANMPTLIKDRTVVMCWDIETYTHGVQTGEAPRPEDTNFEVFMISMIFSWQYSNEPLVRICLLSKPTALAKAMTKPYDYIIVCNGEKNLLKTFGDVVKRMRPDLSIAFNGGGFDWPIVREQALRHGVLKHLKDSFSCLQGGSKETDQQIYKWNFYKEKVKISAEEPKFETLTAKFPGVLDADCMVVFKQLYPTAETGKGSSLNFYLRMNKLEGKEDMDYKRMFRIFEMDCKIQQCTCGDVNKPCSRTLITDYFREGLTVKPAWFTAEDLSKHKGKSCRDIILDEMSLVCWYCVIDAYRCQQLFVIRSIVDDKRELSNMSYVSLYDSFFRANGMKVRNLIGAYCNDNGKMFSNAKTDNDKIKYPGAWVFPPKKGLNNKRPTVALDASSLYPSEMMAHNLSPDKAIVRRDDKRKDPKQIEAIDKYAEALKLKGYELREVKFHCNEANVDVEGWTVHHRGNHGVDHTGVKIIEGYEKNADGTLRHDKNGNCIPIYGREALPGETMGIFPFILKKLFDRRAALKKIFVGLGKLKEKCETEMKKYKRDDGTIDYAAFITQKDLENTGYDNVSQVDYADVCFRRNKVDSKQKAMKVHMNTFYGESGNFLSPIYELLVAGGITDGGQHSIKCVSGYLTKHGYDVRYGDTDSNYLCCPDWMFATVDKKYEEHLQTINGLANGLPMYDKGSRPEYWKTLIKPHWKILNDIYGKVDAKFADDIKAKRCKRDDYYADDSSFNEALTYVKSKLNGETDESRAIVEAFRSRSREDYWIKMVQITRCDVEELRVKVNDALTIDNSTEFIKMAYEEVLFPAVFTGKKKYFGYQHLERENFHPSNKELFIKGVDIVKQGQTELAKEWGYDFIQEICSIDNYCDIEEVIQEKLRLICAKKFETKYFIKSGKYKKPKPGKPGNQTIIPFVKRMAETREMYQKMNDPMTAALYQVPEYGDRIFWVVVRKDHTRDLRGRKVNPKISDKMEYVEVYEASLKTDHPLEIDMEYYLESSIFGLFARFMAYKKEFEPENAHEIDWDDKEQYEKYDKYVIKEANRYIVEFCAGLDPKEVPKDTKGRIFQKIYKEINSAAQSNLVTQFGAASFLIFGLNWYDDKTQEANRTGNFVVKSGRLIDRLKLQFEEFTEVGRNYGRDYLHSMEEKEIPINSVHNMYMSTKTNSLRDMFYDKCTKEITKSEIEFQDRLEGLIEILERYDKGINVLINDIRRKNLEEFIVDGDVLDIVAHFSDADTKYINETFEVVVKLLTYMKIRKQIRSICLAIEERLQNIAREAAKSSAAK